MEEVKKKKSILKRWWFWVIVVIVIIIIAASVGGNSNDNTLTDDKSGDTNTPSAPEADNDTNEPSAITVSKELGSGHYTAGIDFPSGTYNIEAVSGGGNVSSSNAMSGGINAVMGTAEKNNEIGTDMYEQTYSNISLNDGVTLSVSSVTIKITSDNASGKALNPRNQTISEEVTLGNGNFVAGKDFSAGTYDLSVVSGGGNVSSDNMMNGGLNLIMGTEAKNKEIGSDMYSQSFKNAEFTDGVTLTIDGVKIKLTPSK